MKTTIRILSYYTIALTLYTIVTLSLSIEVVIWVPFYLPVIALALMVVLGTRGRFKRTIMAIVAGYTAVLYLYFVALGVAAGFTAHFDPFTVILASLHVPVVVFAGLVLVARRRNAV